MKERAMEWLFNPLGGQFWPCDLAALCLAVLGPFGAIGLAMVAVEMVERRGRRRK